MTVLEPDVTFTDYGLAVECALFATWLVRSPVRNPRLQPWFIVFFVGIGLAALTGGTVHGFFPDEQSAGFRILWPVTLLSIGATAVSAWAIGAGLLFSEPVGRRVIAVAWIVFSAYAVVVLAVNRTFAVAVSHYAPAALFLLAALVVRYVRTRVPREGVGAAAMVLMMVAALVQHAEVAAHPQYFNHNALYHVLQGIALALLYVAARALLDSPTQRG